MARVIARIQSCITARIVPCGTERGLALGKFIARVATPATAEITIPFALPVIDQTVIAVIGSGRRRAAAGGRGPPLRRGAGAGRGVTVEFIITNARGRGCAAANRGDRGRRPAAGRQRSVEIIVTIPADGFAPGGRQSFPLRGAGPAGRRFPAALHGRRRTRGAFAALLAFRPAAARGAGGVVIMEVITMIARGRLTPGGLCPRLRRRWRRGTAGRRDARGRRRRRGTTGGPGAFPFAGERLGRMFGCGTARGPGDGRAAAAARRPIHGISPRPAPARRAAPRRSCPAPAWPARSVGPVRIC